MRRFRNYGTLLACAAAALLVVPAPSAPAKQERGILDRSLFAAFELKGTNGYSVEVITFGGRFALLSASRGQVNASYAVLGRISNNQLKARFGNLGRISVRFIGSSPKREGSQSKRCQAFDLVIEEGTFKGTIKFSGEKDFTEIDARRAKGVVIGLGSRNCGGDAKPSVALFPSGPTTQLTAVTKRKGKTLSLTASRFGDNRRLLVSAGLLEQRAKMQISRSASAFVGGKNAFTSSDVGEHPAYATLRPPKPFSGTGAFTENPLPSKGSPLSSSWRGSIAAWLPGAGRVRMAGPKFASNLCRRSLESTGCSIFPTVQRESLIRQDSGSQSQAFREVMLSWSRYRRNSSSSVGSTP